MVNSLRKELLKAALGDEPCDIVFKNANVFNPFSCTWELCDFGVKDGIVIGKGDYEGKEETDLGGAKVIPGLIEAHVHIESSLLTPGEYGRLMLRCGVTTVIADPHEIANVCGKKGIEYMISEAEKTAADIFYMLPSCVPATPLDRAGAVLSAADLKEIYDRYNVADSAGNSDCRGGIIGLGEMMNYPGVIGGDEEVFRKLGICEIRDGHSPQLSGKSLNAYMMQGIGSDHECTSYEEGYEKLTGGMHILIRDSTAEDGSGLISLVNPCTASRCMFATDDRHVDFLCSNGSIDDCIRNAIARGLAPDLAYRIATLSAAEYFGLNDRGAIAPGRLADFCVIDESCPEKFRVVTTYKRGEDVGKSAATFVRPAVLDSVFDMPEISAADIALPKRCGVAHVIGIVKGQIITENLRMNIDTANIPDMDENIIKCVVCGRYGTGKIGVGLVKGLGLAKGAIAVSVSHDSHNVIAAGCSDDEIVRALNLVRENRGGMCCVCGDDESILPLSCGALMSYDSYERVNELLCDLNESLIEICVPDITDSPFIHLSFLALTVIPALKITERGLFDGNAFTDIDLFG